MKSNRPILQILCLITAISPAWTQDPAPPARTQYSPERIFQLWDKNADGQLTRDEVQREQLFARLDKNGDGVITQEEAAGIGQGGAGQAQSPSVDQAQRSGAESLLRGRPGLGKAAKWRDAGVAQGAPLPPAENFKPRAHGDEAQAAGLIVDVLARLDVEMQRHIAAGNVAGVVALIHRNGQRGYFEAFGMQDIASGQPMPKDAIFRLMSMTKPVIAVCALTLYDEGRFTLDEPIAKHLPEWAAPQVLESGQLVPAKSAITPRMLMSHSSGLYYGTLDRPGHEADEGGGAAALAYAASRGARASLKEFSETLAKQPLKFHPGEGYQYGHSIDILGRYIEAVTGKPLDEVLRERVCGPLKMTDTDFWVRPDKAARIATLYQQPRPGVLEPARDASRLTEKPSLFLGGHGLCSTAADYERFCRMILNRGELDGARVLKPETVDLMFQNHLKTPGQQYGLGGAVDGEGGYSWGGANGTQFWMDRKNNLLAIFMVQTQHYRAPTYNVFRALAHEAAGIARGRGARIAGNKGV